MTTVPQALAYLEEKRPAIKWPVELKPAMSVVSPEATNEDKAIAAEEEAKVAARAAAEAEEAAKAEALAAAKAAKAAAAAAEAAEQVWTHFTRQ